MQTRRLTIPEKFLIALALVLANWRAIMFIYLYPDTSKPWGGAWVEILLWVLVAAGLSSLSFRSPFAHDYLARWRRNGWLALFVLLALISIFWSLAPVVTLFRALELLLATVIAAWLGTRFQPEEITEFLFWFGAGLFILSIALAFGAPKTGTMYWAPFDGAWRGVYWHRNHLASVAALLSTVYLCRALSAFKNRNSQGVLDGILYLTSLVILYYAKSATGYIVFLVLNAFVLGIWLWLQVAQRLHRRHYLFLLSGLALAAVLVLFNLDRVFGLFHRDTTLTGRVSLWKAVLDFASQRLWLGHGFGAVWTLDWFREQMKQIAAWTSQPLIGDNGFLDIFLHLGIIGLVLFAGVLLLTTVRSIRYGLGQKTLLGFFPLLIMVYAFFGNITFSLFAETEVFVWSLIVAALFMTTSGPKAVD